jgi:hypothetical protein
MLAISLARVIGADNLIRLVILHPASQKRERISAAVLVAHLCASFARSPDERLVRRSAERVGGSDIRERLRSSIVAPGFALLTRATQERRKRNAGRRICFTARTSGCGSRHGEAGLRQPSAAGALACRRSTTVLAQGSIPSQRLNSGPGFPEGSAASGGSSPPAPPPGRSEAPRTPVVMPAGMMPGSPGSGS